MNSSMLYRPAGKGSGYSRNPYSFTRAGGSMGVFPNQNNLSSQINSALTKIAQGINRPRMAEDNGRPKNQMANQPQTNAISGGGMGVPPTYMEQSTRQAMLERRMAQQKEEEEEKRRIRQKEIDAENMAARNSQIKKMRSAAEAQKSTPTASLKPDWAKRGPLYGSVGGGLLPVDNNKRGSIKSFSMDPMMQMARIGRQFEKIKQMQNPNILTRDDVPLWMRPDQWMQSIRTPQFPAY